MGRAQLAPLQLARIHRTEQQLGQGLSHRVLLFGIQRQHQRQPQPVGQQAKPKPGQPRQPQQRAAHDQRLACAVAQPLAQIGGDRPVQVWEHRTGRQPGETIGAEIAAQFRQQLLHHRRRRRGALQPAGGAAPQQRRFLRLGLVCGGGQGGGVGCAGASLQQQRAERQQTLRRSGQQRQLAA